mgnify:CR=1 FL=1
MRLRILLVDDHEVVRIGLKSVLTRYNQFEIVGEASNAQEALEKTVYCNPDIVVMDIRLPGRSGIEATREIIENHPETKVIILTSYADDEMLFDAIAAGAAGYVLKQIGSEDLVRALPADAPDKDEQLLLWAGRAVTSGNPEVARSLLDEVAFPPEGQGWRLQATKAMVFLAEGDTEQAMSIFDALKSGTSSGDVPRDGLDDALATACTLTEDVQIAQKLVEGLESAAAARCLVDAGAPDEALRHAPEGTLRAFLENK